MECTIFYILSRGIAITLRQNFIVTTKNNSNETFKTINCKCALGYGGYHNVRAAD